MSACEEQFILKTSNYETEFLTFNRIYRLVLIRNDPYFVSKKLVNYFFLHKKRFSWKRINPCMFPTDPILNVMLPTLRVRGSSNINLACLLFSLESPHLHKHSNLGLKLSAIYCENVPYSTAIKLNYDFFISFKREFVYFISLYCHGLKNIFTGDHR